MALFSVSERTERLPCKFRNISLPRNKNVSVSKRDSMRLLRGLELKCMLECIHEIIRQLL